MKHFIQKIFEATYNTKPKRSRLDPVIATIGDHEVTRSMVEELVYRMNQGYRIREQLEMHAQECCIVLGVDPDKNSIERDWCEQIVTMGSDPAIAMENLINLRGTEIVGNGSDNDS